MKPARPFIKWAGGKSRLLDELLRRLPWALNVHGRRHVEPFLGGGALFFAREPVRALLADVNPRLISTYTAVRDEPDRVLEWLAQHSAKHSKEHYLATREQFNMGEEWFGTDELAAMFIYLNKTGFNGLYRENAEGDFNVPWGKKTSFAPDPEGLRRASAALQKAELVCGDFETVLGMVAEDDFVYLDPPYDLLDETSNFTTYAKGGFDWSDQERLARAVGRLVLRRVPVMVSNHDTERVRRALRGLRIESIEAPRSVGAHTRASAREIIARSY